jgi:hypothetical protein
LKKFIETANLLKSIKADDLDHIYNNITDKAVEWAAGGFLGYANRLLQDLWAFHPGDPGNVRRQLEGLQILWELSGNFPSAVPFTFRKTEEIEEENWDDIRLINPTQSENVSDILQQLETDIQHTSGFHYGTLAAGAAILALGSGLPLEGEKFIRYWGLGYMQDYSYSTGYLLRNRYSSTILLKGVLSSLFELTEEKCLSEYEALSAALKDRKAKGRTLIYGDQSWTSLLKNISILSIGQDPELFPEERILSQWLGNDPAPEEKILAAEEKIGMPLPSDYREFLMASDGFAAHSYIAPSLLTVEDIGWLSVVYEDLVEYVEQILEWSKEKYARLSSKCLLVSGFHEEEQVLLFPTSDKGWECWSLVLGGGCGETWYASFRHYMEYRLYFSECR